MGSLLRLKGKGRVVGTSYRALDLHKTKISDASFKYPNAFLVQSPAKSFVLQAPDADSCRAWRAELISCVASCQEEHVKAAAGVAPVPGDRRASSVDAIAEDAVVAPLWEPDTDADVCNLCQVRFTTFKRRHHCRHCGACVCGMCSAFNWILPHISDTKKVRVCRKCYFCLVKERRSSGGDAVKSLASNAMVSPMVAAGRGTGAGAGAGAGAAAAAAAAAAATAGGSDAGAAARGSAQIFGAAMSHLFTCVRTCLCVCCWRVWAVHLSRARGVPTRLGLPPLVFSCRHFPDGAGARHD